MQKNMSIEKNATRISMVAIRDNVVFINAVPKSTVVRQAMSVLQNIFLANRYISGINSVPNSAHIKRQPKGFMPNRAIPMEIILFPKGGCVFS